MHDLHYPLPQAGTLNCLNWVGLGTGWEVKGEHCQGEGGVRELKEEHCQGEGAGWVGVRGNWHRYIVLGSYGHLMVKQ